MIEQGAGDLLACEVDALVNAVNTVGVMGKGLALQFKKAFPDNFKAYERACASGQVVVGRMFVVERSMAPRFIINFPTKTDWRHPSKLEYISAGSRILPVSSRRWVSGRLRCPRWGAAWVASIGRRFGPSSKTPSDGPLEFGSYSSLRSERLLASAELVVRLSHEPCKGRVEPP
jgi:hypothetical protein